MKHSYWLELAERVDALRVFPRAIMAGYYVFFAHAWYYVVDWFMGFDWSTIADDEALALAVAGFPATILAVLTGVLSTLTKAYFASGRKWDDATMGTTGGE
jgi:hypothetical protein